MNIFVRWVLWFVAAEGVLTAVQFFLRKKEIKTYARVILIIVKLLLAVAFAALPMAGPVQLRPVQPFMMALYAALLTDAFADIVYGIFRKIKKIGEEIRRFKNTQPCFRYSVLCLRNGKYAACKAELSYIHFRKA